MKKLLIKLISVCLAGLFSFSLVGCNGCNEQNDDTGNTPPKRDDVIIYDGSHDFKVEELDEYFIKEGQTQYKIIYSENPTKYELEAVKEFNALLKHATGLELVASNDSGLTHNPTNKYISFGKTTLFNTSGLTVNFEELENEGARIITKDNTIFLLGGKTNGIIFSVHDFMNIYFNFETYYTDVMEIDRNVTQAKLLKFDVIDIPDIALRAKNFNVYSQKSDDYDENMFRTRMRMTNARELLPIHKKYDKSSPSSIYDSHNSEFFLPRAEYFEDHPKWFSDNGDQLCYTAHGDEQELNLMIEECVKKIQYSLMQYSPEEYPNYNVVALNIMDNRYICSCKACSANFRKYDDCNSASTIMFMNEMAKRVDAWMELAENAAYKRELKYIFFAYLDLEPCPARYNEQTKKYEPIDDNVKLYKNVGVYLALLDSFEYQVSVYNDINKKGRKIVEAWSDMTDYIWYWLYSANYTSNLYLYDSFNFFAEGYSYIASHSAELLFIEAQNGLHALDNSWLRLKLYLDSKLSWNSSLNITELVDKWFNAMFKEAAPTMKQVFYDMRVHYNDMIANNGLVMLRSNFNKVYDAKYWNYNAVKTWLAQMDSAKTVIEQLYKDTDLKTYETIINNIENECFAPAFMQLHLFSNNLSQEEQYQLAQRVEYDLEYLGAIKTSDSYKLVKDVLATI